MAAQLDRIETKVGTIADIMPGVRNRPPPLPSKDDDSPPSSPSSVSSTSTARPATPPNMDVLSAQFDDMRNLLGTLIGRTDDIANEVARRRSFEAELEPRGPGLRRLEDLMRRALYRLGDSEFEHDLRQPLYDEKSVYGHDTASEYTSGRTATGSLYEGSEGMYPDDFGSRLRGPPNSFTDSFEKSRRGWTRVPESLLDGPLPDAEFDEEFLMANLPPDTPPSEYELGHVRVPPHIAARLPQRTYQSETGYAPSEYTQALGSEASTPRPPPREMEDGPPIPFRHEPLSDDQQSYYTEEDEGRGPLRGGPPPQPVDVPTPVRSPGHIPPTPGYPGMRPPFMAGGMPPPPPGVGEMPRPSLPRIAGVRDPISTT